MGVGTAWWLAVGALSLAVATLCWVSWRLVQLRRQWRSALAEVRGEQQRLRQHLLRLGEYTLRLERRLNRATEQFELASAARRGDDVTPEQLRPLLDDMRDAGTGDSEAERALRALLEKGAEGPAER